MSKDYWNDIQEEFNQLNKVDSTEGLRKLTQTITEKVVDLIEQDIIKSLQWFTKSAEQGFVFGQYNLAVILAAGDGVAKNNKEEIKWLSLL